MSTEDTLQLPRVYISRQNLPAVISKAYELSQPQGMGRMHYIPGPLPQESIDKLMQLVDEGAADVERGKRISLDYVQGRAVKLTFHWDVEQQKHFINNTGAWFDHSVVEHTSLLVYIEQLEGAAS